MMRALLPLLALALLAARCSPAPEPAPSGDPDACAGMCETIDRLGCAEAWGIEPEDGACLDFCRQIERQGNTSLCPALVAMATSCEEADEFSQREDCGR